MGQVEKEYNSAEVIVNIDDSDISDFWDPKVILVKNLTDIKPRTIFHQTRVKNIVIFNKLYRPYIGSKLTWIVRHDKSMTAITNKEEEVHIDLLDLHNSSSLSRSLYALILICKHTQKT